MRFRVEASDGQVLVLDASDWMMALVIAANRMGHQVGGFSCEPQADGVVRVIDRHSERAWTVSPASAPSDAPGEPPASASGPARLVPPQHRRWTSPLRKPMWSPGTPRGASDPSAPHSDPPPNLPEQLLERSHEIQRCEAPVAPQRTLALILALVSCEAGSVLLGRAEQEQLVFAAVAGPAAEELRGRRIPYGMGIAGAACVSGVTVQVEDVAGDPRHLASFDAETGFRTRSLLCVPLRTEAALFGVIQVLNPPGDRFDDWQVHVVESLALALARRLSGQKPRNA